MIEGLKIAKQSFSTSSLESALEAILIFCKEENLNIAAYRKPQEDDIIVLIDTSSPNYPSDLELEELNPGFVFAPFDKDEKRYFISGEIKINLSKGKVISSDHQDVTNEIIDFINDYKSQKRGSNIAPAEVDYISNDYEQLVQKSIDGIKHGLFQKVVPSRKKTVTLNDNYRVSKHFLSLESSYNNSFISLVYTKETNIWLGATPEVLIETHGDIFKTVALAGTQAFNKNEDLNDVSWRQKEIEEQAFVSRYIINCFKKIRLREFEEKGPKTIVAGNLIHLKTDFIVDMEATNFPQLGSVMLELLHPTSAICGMPLESSLEFIKAHEDLDRKFFSGYLGPVNIKDQTSIYVNLRCMEIEGNLATLYAGAGVTENSNPHKEWLETEMKMKTLLNLIE